MAILELGIEINGLGKASSDLKGLNSIINQTVGTLDQNIRQNAQYSKSLEDISRAIKWGRGDITELRKEQEALRSAIQSNKTAIRNQINDLNASDGSLVSLRSQLNLATKAYDQLTKSERENASVGGLLVKNINSIQNEIKAAEQATGRFQRSVGNYQNALRGANGVNMEFNRIIQDAPYGMMGIGNNIQQLAANWQVYSRQAKEAAAASGQTMTAMGLLKGVAANFLTTGNLLTFGIAAITSAWTAYSMNVKTAKEQTKDMNNQFTTQLGQLQNVISLTEKSAKTERDKATAVSEYNKNLGDTLGKVKSYGELEKNLIKNGANYVKYLTLKSQAEATYQLALKNTATMMENVMTLESKGRSTGFGGWVLKAGDTIDELVYGKGSKGKTKITSQDALRIAQLPTDKEFYIAIRGMGDGLKRGLKDVRADWKKTLQAGSLGSDLTQQFNKVADQMNLKMPDFEFNVDKDGKNEKKLEKIIDHLKEIYSLSGITAKDIALVGSIGIQYDVDSVNYDLNQKIKELQAYQATILRDTSLSEEKRKDLISKTNEVIKFISDRALIDVISMRDKYSTELSKMLTITPIKTTQDMGVFGEVGVPEWLKESKKLTKELTREITNIIGMLPNLSGGFYDVFSQLTSGIGSLFQKELINNLSETLSKKMKEVDADTMKIAGALTVAGKTLQGLFSQSSVAGQGIGGALSGASAGLSIASTISAAAGPWGAAIGGVVGLVSGIFGGRKKRKEEERQRQQLEEQKKTNALLERMNALAYTSSIIGGKTTDGIVTGVNRNEFGEITFRIEGKDLVTSLSRQNAIGSR